MLKRAATNELNHENWDQEEEEEEPSKEFKMASSDVLSKRVFKRGKRRLAESTSQAQPSPFAKFSFGATNTNSTAATPSSSPFSFLSDSKKSPAPLNGNVDDSPKKDDTPKEDDKKTLYLSKLRGLNEEFLSWITKHIEKNAYCILTPCFEDYTKYLEKIQEERGLRIDSPRSSAGNFKSPMLTSNKDGAQSPFASGFFSNVKSSPLGDSKASDSKTLVGASIFGNTASSTFSFGNGKPFTFSSTGPLSTSESKPPAAANEDESDEPPKNEFNLVKEEDAVFSQRVKVFVKKDKEDYAERGVGTLYVKPVNDKFQVVVRADTSLGNLLVNIVLSESMPMKRMGKNNVLLVCVPVPGQDTKPIPTLLRVKTKEDADKLFEELEKRKK